MSPELNGVNDTNCRGTICLDEFDWRQVGAITGGRHTVSRADRQRCSPACFVNFRSMSAARRSRCRHFMPGRGERGVRCIAAPQPVSTACAS